MSYATLASRFQRHQRCCRFPWPQQRLNYLAQQARLELDRIMTVYALQL